MTLKTKMAADTLQTFLNTNEFAEDITYVPYGGTNKSIKAVLIRRGLDPAGEDTGRIMHNQVEIMIARDINYGMTSIKKGQDKVILPANIGGDDDIWLVVDILGQDDGMWHLLVQK
jgi:hypothetical protein